MAQAEDTELRDLVIEALEKNGSLAKIRALLRANVFLAFENECENVKQNVNLDNILQLPEGLLCLSLVHEFLEFCNLKNTLFVYMSESRQGNEYKYQGRKTLTEKFNISVSDNNKEPILVTLLKSILKLYPRKCDKDDQNCTYIVHDETSGSTSNSHSQSDNSSDERNKLHLRLHLDNSDTDTSSDSARDKSSSEYIPNAHILRREITKTLQTNNLQTEPEQENNKENIYSVDKDMQFLKSINPMNNSSSESTSYIDLKPYNVLEKKLLNTTAVPFEGSDKKEIRTAVFQLGQISQTEFQQGNISKTDSIVSPASLSDIPSISHKKDDNKYDCVKATGVEESVKSDATVEYTYDFTSSSVVKDKDIKNIEALSPPSIQEEYLVRSPNKNSSKSHQNSPSSQSSISISDVAELISEKSSPQKLINPKNISYDKEESSHSPKINTTDYNKHTDDSGDFSESPIPSLSNLSLDIQSD